MLFSGKLQYNDTGLSFCTPFDPAIKLSEGDAILVSTMKRDEVAKLFGTELYRYGQCRDMKTISFEDGKLPVIFHLNNLPKQIIDGMTRLFPGMPIHCVLFAFGVRQIDNIQPHVLTPGAASSHPGAPFSLMADQEIEMFGQKIKHLPVQDVMLAFNDNVIQDVAAVLEESSFLAVGTKPILPVPYSSQRLILMRYKEKAESLTVAAKQETQE